MCKQTIFGDLSETTAVVKTRPKTLARIISVCTSSRGVNCLMYSISLTGDRPICSVHFFNTLKAQQYGQHFSCNLSCNNVALQVEMVCCAYYHILAKQIFKLQNVKVTSTFCKINKSSQLATQHCCGTSCKKNVARINRP